MNEEEKKQKKREYNRKWRLKNIDSIREKARLLRIEKGDKIREYYREYFKRRRKEEPEFKEKQDAHTNRYRNTPNGKKYVKEYNSRTEVKERNKKWFDNHPGYRNTWARKNKLAKN